MDGFAREKRGEACWRTARRDRAKPLTLFDEQGAVGGFAQSRRLLQHCLENRGKVARGAVDDLQDFGGRGLLFQGLARLGYEACVLHGDDRLSRKVLEKSNLIV